MLQYSCIGKSLTVTSRINLMTSGTWPWDDESEENSLFWSSYDTDMMDGTIDFYSFLGHIIIPSGDSPWVREDVIGYKFSALKNKSIMISEQTKEGAVDELMISEDGNIDVLNPESIMNFLGSKEENLDLLMKVTETPRISDRLFMLKNLFTEGGLIRELCYANMYDKNSWDGDRILSPGSILFENEDILKITLEIVNEISNENLEYEKLPHGIKLIWKEDHKLENFDIFGSGCRAIVKNVPVILKALKEGKVLNLNSNFFFDSLHPLARPYILKKLAKVTKEKGWDKGMVIICEEYVDIDVIGSSCQGFNDIGFPEVL